MAVGRIFPIPNPTRVFPVDPVSHGDTHRDAPLPFVIGVGSQDTIETTYEVAFVMQRYIVEVVPDDQGGAGVSVCTSTTNLYCVPQATVTKDDSPTAVVRCAQ